MKVTIDSKTGEVKVNGKLLKDAPEHYKTIAEYSLRLAYNDNFPLTDYEEDCMWMSYRYCIGRHTIASNMHAGDIWENCRGRMSKDREAFTAYDINNRIEDCLAFRHPYFRFPCTTTNKIYVTAVDAVCEFMEEYKITSISDFLKYRDIEVILTDNERGYKFETTTWEEWLRPQVHKIVSKYYDNDAMLEDYAWKYYTKWKENPKEVNEELSKEFDKITKDMPNEEHYYMSDFEDLFVWNDLVHCFDQEHHHKSVLKDGTESVWFWSWTHKTEQHEDGYYYRAFGYERIRVPLESWNGGSITTWIPDESIKEDIY